VVACAEGTATTGTTPDDDDGTGATGGGGTGTGTGTGANGGQGGQIEDGCGDGDLDAGEACDAGPDNGAADGCCDASCALVTAGTVCRAGSGDDCDPDEACDGTSPTCPADVLEDDAFACRADADGDGCDVAEVCSGVAGEACPADEAAGAGTPCGDGVGQPTCNPDACDAAGNCVDAATLPDSSPCTEGGGDACCAGLCVASTSAGCCGLPATGVLVVDIIESQSSIGQDMDVEWQTVAAGMGHTATIRQQTFLDNIASLAATDVLIVSSGVIGLPSARVATIQSFLGNGGGVYLQGEYQITYETNLAFAQIVNATGGTFTWSMTVSGELSPATVGGCIGSAPEAISPLNYHWYGATGTGSPEVLITTGGTTPIGWSHCLPGTTDGQLIHTTDQDFIKESTAEDQAFMRNVIARLAFATACH
jgi:hypothetical protein